MTRYTKEKLYELLPNIYRQSDKESGGSLEALIDIVAKQIEIIEDDIDGLYDNWFIETCDEWVVPYIADLGGAKGAHASGDNSVSQRPMIANTINYRRRKGTVGGLEQMAHDVTGWSAKVVEFFQLLNTTQNINHVRLGVSSFTPDLRDMDSLELLGSPLDNISHIAEIRSIKHNQGHYNLRNIGLFLWRLQPYPVKNTPAFNHNKGRFSFNRLGYDVPLFNNPDQETSFNVTAGELHIPSPIRKNALRDNLGGYYAEDDSKSIRIEVNDSVVNANDIVVADLRHWKHPKHEGYVAALDPVLGRILFASSFDHNERVYVSYYYGFSAPLGGGFYTRPMSASDIESANKISDTTNYYISKRIGPLATTINNRIQDGTNEKNIFYLSINDALSRWDCDGKPNAIFEIIDSEEYDEDLKFATERNLEIRSAPNQNPLLRGCIDIEGHSGASITMDGLLLDTRKEQKRELININKGLLSSLTIRHCTLLPRRTASIELDGASAGGEDGRNNELTITLDHTISGRINIINSEAKLKVLDSIIDRKQLTHHTSDAGKKEIFDPIKDNALNCYRIAEIQNSTIFGKTHSTILDLASNSIFTDIVIVERHQMGCIRYCYIPRGSQVPPIYHCQPNHDSISENGSNPGSSPIFTSEVYCDAGYAQLHKDVSQEIFEGADNGSEIGVFNSLRQDQRLKILKASLNDYLPSGLELGIFKVDCSSRSNVKVVVNNSN